MANKRKIPLLEIVFPQKNSFVFTRTLNKNQPFFFQFYSKKEVKSSTVS